MTPFDRAGGDVEDSDLDGFAERIRVRFDTATSQPPAVTSTAGTALRRGLRMRRRRRASRLLVLASGAAVVVDGTTLAISRSPSPGTATAAGRTSQPAPSTSLAPSPAGPGATAISPASGAASPPTAQGPRVPYVKGHVLTIGSTSVQLPHTWVGVNSLLYAGGTVVLDVMPQVDQGTSAIVVHGVLTEVTELIGPIDLSQDGNLVLGLSRTKPAPPDTPREIARVVVYDVAAKKVRTSLPGGYDPVAFVGRAGSTVWVRARTTNESLLWDVTSGTVSPIPVPGGYAPIAVDPTGNQWIAAPARNFSSLSAFQAGSATAVWTASIADIQSADFTPDGSRLIVGGEGTLVMINAASGAREGTATGLPTGAWTVQTWEPSGALLARRNLGDPLRRCDPTTDKCSTLTDSPMVARTSRPSQ